MLHLQSRLGSGRKTLQFGNSQRWRPHQGFYSHLFKQTAQMVKSHQGPLQRSQPDHEWKYPPAVVFFFYVAFSYSSFLHHYYSSCGPSVVLLCNSAPERGADRMLLHGKSSSFLIWKTSSQTPILARTQTWTSISALALDSPYVEVMVLPRIGFLCCLWCTCFDESRASGGGETWMPGCAVCRKLLVSRPSGAFGLTCKCTRVCRNRGFDVCRMQHRYTLKLEHTRHMTCRHVLK